MKLCSGETLSAYIDGELDEKTSREVQAHLFVCRECHREIEFLRQTTRLVQRLGDRQAPPGFVSQVSRRLLESPLPKVDALKRPGHRASVGPVDAETGAELPPRYTSTMSSKALSALRRLFGSVPVPVPVLAAMAAAIVVLGFVSQVGPLATGPAQPGLVSRLSSLVGSELETLEPAEALSGSQQGYVKALVEDHLTYEALLEGEAGVSAGSQFRLVGGP
ncbi:MAG: zf-HC2 domain-containing protein [Firmicutes bacterium]|nr:zf-HC2 domain-containing protein [Bacillota bacterium]